MKHTAIETTQNEETRSGVYQSGNNGTFVLFHGITSKQYKTKAGALKAWNKLVSMDLV
jgi:hypothetical protein